VALCTGNAGSCVVILPFQPLQQRSLIYISRFVRFVPLSSSSRRHHQHLDRIYLVECFFYVRDHRIISSVSAKVDAASMLEQLLG
jgi:hypothetical protein